MDIVHALTWIFGSHETTVNVEFIRNEASSEYIDIEKDFENHEKQIREFAQQLRGLIQKVKNLCSSESRILRDIVNMRKQLSDRLTSVSNFNVKIQDASVHIVGYLSQIERQVDNLGTQNWENKKHLETLEDNLYVAASRSVWLNNELMKVKGELNQITDFERDQADVATVPVFGWVAAIGMEVVLLLGNAEEKKIRYENLLNELSPKISDIQIEINECRQKIVQIYYDIGKCERKKSQAQAEQLLIKKSRDTINIWLKTMNIWLEYLTTLEPQAERVETHIGLSQTALNSAIEEFKIFVNSASENAIQAATNILAIAYTPTSGILENITLPLNDS